MAPSVPARTAVRRAAALALLLAGCRTGDSATAPDRGSTPDGSAESSADAGPPGIDAGAHSRLDALSASDAAVEADVATWLDATTVETGPDGARPPNEDASGPTDAGDGDAPPFDAAPDVPGCTSTAGCDGGNCVAGACITATCTDAVKDGTETDVDCGGLTCAPCGHGGSCLVARDCTTGGCDYKGRCALSPSCTQHHGGDTCGAGEDTDLGATPHPASNEESCCTTIAIPGTTLTVDKYLITAGRIRAWVDAFAGDLRAFTTSIPASNPHWNPAWNAYIPSTLAEVAGQLGPYPAPLTPSPYAPTNVSLDADGEPSGNWLGQWRDGCSMGAPGAPDGARTWWSATAIGSDAAPVAYPQAFLDDKLINCIDSYMLTAFCIWDGGHLATDAELAAAWGAGPLPWSGQAPLVLVDQATQLPTGLDALGRDASAYVAHEFGTHEFVAPFTYNYDPYALGADSSVHIPAPGRFPLGAGPYGHMDLAGATYEATAIKAGVPLAPPLVVPTSVKQVDHVGTVEGGSWEIHPIITGAGSAVVYDPWMPAYWAYWAMGSRCGR